VAPDNAPDKTPTKVIPTWTVDRNRPGLLASARLAARANDVAIDQSLQTAGEFEFTHHLP
jgi:hypothetical protein